MSCKLLFFVDPHRSELGAKIELPRQGDAGFDLRSTENLLLEPGTQAIVPTGVKVAVPLGYVGIIKDRSSMAVKRVYTHAGVIDSGYRGEVRIVLSNQGHQSYHIESGAKIAQMVVVPCLVEATQVNSEAELGETERGHGGFGSTGVK